MNEPQTTTHETEIAALKHSLRQIRQAVFKGASDVLWISDHETVVDRINCHLGENCTTLEECEEADA